MVLAVLTFLGEVNNGGFDQFFRNLRGDMLPRLFTVSDIEAAMAEPNETHSRVLERCDIAFYERPGAYERLLAYVKAHPDGIRI
jgi:Domain of unknown function (DUF4375)